MPCRGQKKFEFDPWVEKIPWRRKWQPKPALLPGKFHGQRSFMGYNPWGCKEVDTLSTHTSHIECSLCEKYCWKYTFSTFYLILIITLQTSVTIICSLHIRKWNHVVVEILLKSYKYEVEEPDTLDLSSMLSTTTARLLRYCVKRCKPVGAQTLNQDLC